MKFSIKDFFSKCEQIRSFQKTVIYFQLQTTSTARKTIFFFSKCSEKIVFPKKTAQEYDLSCITRPGKMIFLFPENMILLFRREMKGDLSQKSTWKYDIFFKCSEKMVFPKKSHWNIIFLLSSGKMAFLSPENMIFFLRTENER